MDRHILSRTGILPTLLSLSLLLSVFPVYGRQGITVSGKVTASEDQQPVPHTNITIDRKGIATATNSAGLFALIIPAANLSDTLKISCIGFKTKYLPISGLKDKEKLDIVLEKNVTALNEVAVAYYDAEKVLQKAITSIPDNYINRPHILRGFYRMYTFSDEAPLQLSEAVFDVYNFGYADKRADLFRLIKARNNKNERDFSSLELGQKPNSVFEDDIVNHRPASGFLSDEGMKNHEFKVTGVVDFQGYQAYEIYFKENEGISDDPSFEGRIYIDTKTNAFIHFDFGLNPSGLSDTGLGNFITHALVRTGDVGIALQEDHTEVNYQQVGNKWVLANVEGDHVLGIKGAEAKDTLTAHVKFNYQVTAVDTAAKSSFSSKLDRNANINDHDNDADPKFWKDYNILLSDYDTEDILRQIQAINKLIKEKEK
jgi:hypothetical protein